MPNKLNILVVDDIFINHVILESILLENGHNVKSVKTGLAAVETLKEENFDLILMDINMPEMDGKSATRMIRNLPSPKSETPIIACTADDTEKHRNEYRDIGMNGVISKPISKDNLINALNNYCNGSFYFHNGTQNKGDKNATKTTKALGDLLKKISD